MRLTYKVNDKFLHASSLRYRRTESEWPVALLAQLSYITLLCRIRSTQSVCG